MNDPIYEHLRKELARTCLTAFAAVGAEQTIRAFTGYTSLAIAFVVGAVCCVVACALDAYGRYFKDDLQRAYDLGVKAAKKHVASGWKTDIDCPYGDIRGRAYVWGWSHGLSDAIAGKMVEGA